MVRPCAQGCPKKGTIEKRMGILIQFIATAGAVFLIAENISGITVEGGYPTIFFVALVWSLITLVIKPVLSVLTLPLTFITLGAFALVLNAFLFIAMEWVIPGFRVDGFLPALAGSLILSFVAWVTGKIS